MNFPFSVLRQQQGCSVTYQILPVLKQSFVKKQFFFEKEK